MKKGQKSVGTINGKQFERMGIFKQSWQDFMQGDLFPQVNGHTNQWFSYAKWLASRAAFNHSN